MKNRKDDKVGEEFKALWSAAKRAAEIAAMEKNATLGDQSFNNGFAWIIFPGNNSFARWAKKEGIAKKGPYGGMVIWCSRIILVGTDSITVQETACRAARDILAHGLQTSAFELWSRFD